MDLSALELARQIERRTLSCVEVMAAALSRIAEVNPAVNAIVSLVPEAAAMAQAAACDRELAAGRGRGALHGLPFAVKDLEETAGIATTYGSPLFAEHVPAADSLMVARLRSAGAIIIGKTNVPEFGFGSQSYNTLFGTTLNAYDRRRTAGGSSGGAAVALATHMLPLADGSDYGGSLRNPAAFNNVFGFRPSPGRVPDREADRFTVAQSVLGPMARSVADLALLFSIQAGPDPEAPLCLPERGGEVTAPLQVPVAGRRIGWLGDLEGALPMEDGVLALCESGLATLAACGAVVEPVAPDFAPERIWQSWCQLRSWAAAARFAGDYADPARRPLFKPEILWEIEQGLGLSGMQVAAAMAERGAWARHARTLFQRFDVLALPAAQVFPFAAETHWPREIAGHGMDSYHRWMQVVTPATLAGLPALSVPVGFDARGLPMGMQLIGPAGADLAVLQLGHAYDAATRWPERRPPERRPPG